MDQTERQIIDDLFAKLRQAEAQSGPRDPQAEAHIRDLVARNPAAPYIMAQSIVMMEQGLAAMQSRVEELERRQYEQQRAPSGGGGLFGSLFGGGRPAAPPPRPSAPRPSASPWGQQPATPGDPRVAAYANPQQPRQGGGFMAGAMQTAVGVAGGMLLGNALASAFSGGEAMAEEAVNEVSEHIPEDTGFDDMGFDEEL